jgi:uncharacterized iron-regulated protein
MARFLTMTFLQLVVISIYAQHLPAYQIFSGSGKKLSFRKMVKQLEKKDIILFGEIHDNPIDHWLQLELVRDLVTKRTLTLGAEMFETDNQTVLNQYLQGKIDDLRKDPTMRLWSNYDTDYAPLVNFAREHRIPFIATNVPRDYARQVYRSGFAALETLSAREKEWIAPLPIDFDPDLKTYKDILQMMEHHATPELVMAQALRDATMAHFILKNYVDGHLFVHFNGTYHSEFHEGILWYLRRGNDRLQYATIATATQASLKKLSDENREKADYIIIVDEDMTETH